MISRMVFLSFLLVSLIFFQYRYHIYQIHPRQFIFFSIGVYCASGIFWHFLRRFIHLPFFAYILIGSDTLFISWLVFLTGVIDSGFSILYHISIISASILLYRRGGYFSASLSSILYGAMLDMQFYNVAGFARSQNFSAGQVLYLLFVNILSFYVVAFLSGYLSERLRRTHQELRETSSDFADLRVLQDNILRSVGSGIVTMNMAGEITSWNNAAETITGYPIDEIRARWDSVFGESIKGLLRRTDALRSGPMRFEGRITRKNGLELVLGFTATLLRDDRKNVRGVIVTFQDITRVIKMEEQMRRQERLASIGSLAAGIAHEIRNPLASLSGSIQMLREEASLTGDNKRLMDIILREADRLNTIITEFLDYARPKSMQGEAASVSHIIRETITLFRNSRDARDDIHLSMDVPGDLLVPGDSQRLRQVFWNLLINASQAMASGGDIRITAAAENIDGERTVAVRVSDTGSGIPADLHDKVFDPFFTTKTDGTGLGLAIVYRIVEDHKGTIEVTSQEGRGSTFTVRLPAHEAKSDAAI